MDQHFLGISIPVQVHSMYLVSLRYGKKYNRIFLIKVQYLLVYVINTQYALCYLPRRRLGASFAHLVSCTVHEDKSFCSDIVCVRFKVESPGGQYLFQPFSTKVRHGGTILIEPLAYLLQSSCSTVFSSHSFRLSHVS